MVAMILVLMGVSGSGKTTIGTLLAHELGVMFADADDFHPESNKLKMAAGHALTDEDRQPWLERLNELIRHWQQLNSGGVMACSALKESYRETLQVGMPADAVQFVFLDAPKQLIAARLEVRHHEFMNAHLLQSQLQTLEPPEKGIRVVNDRTPELVLQEILDRLQIRPN